MLQEIKPDFPVIGGVALLVLTLGITACTEAKTNAEQAASQKVSSMNIRFDIEGLAQPEFVRLKDSPTTRNFIRQLPLTLELTDYAATEKIAYLPKKLTSQGAPKGQAILPTTPLGAISRSFTKTSMVLPTISFIWANLRLCQKYFQAITPLKSRSQSI